MGKVLLFQGDTITDCGRASCGGAGYPMYDLGPGYAGIIASKLLAEEPQNDWKIYNRGISGNRIVDLYARWKKDCINLKADILSLLIGINDLGHEYSEANGVDAERFDKFYRMLLDWCLESKPDMKFILMEPFVLPFGYVKDFWLADVAERGNIVRKIAKDYKTQFIPLQDIFNEAAKKAPLEYWMVDGVHPTNAGHWLIVQEWLKCYNNIK